MQKIHTSVNTRIIDYVGLTECKITNEEITNGHSNEVNTTVTVKLLDVTRYKNREHQNVDVLILPRISNLTDLNTLLTSEKEFERALGKVLEQIERLPEEDPPF